MTKEDLDQPTKLEETLTLAEVKQTLLSFQEQTFTVKECPVEVFDAFVSQYDDHIQNVDRQKWSIFQRWRMINFLIEQHVLEVHDGQLVEVEDVPVEAKPITDDSSESEAEHATTI